MDKIQIATNIQFEEEPDAKGHLNFLGYVPCVFKPTFREGLDNVLRSYRKETGAGFRSYVPVSCSGSGADIYDNVWKTPDIDDLPDAIASGGFGDFFRKQFVERFVNKGYFKNVWEGPVNKPFEEAGLIDPDGWYTVYSVMPFVMLVDGKRLGDLPAPKRWSDLLDPRFRDKVILPGTEDQMAGLPLLHFYKEHGEEGLRTLAANMKAPWYSAEMARLAGSSKSAAAVYVMSWFFAQSCPKTGTVSAVWPEDGALASPLYLLVKKEKREETAPVINYTLGPELGRQSAQSCFPVINPQVDNMLPEGASFKWLGWDYVKSHDMAELDEYVQALFLSTWKESH